MFIVPAGPLLCIPHVPAFLHQPSQQINTIILDVTLHCVLCNSQGDMSGSDVESGSDEGESGSEDEQSGSELGSDEYGADAEDGDVDRKYEDAMES